MIQKLIINRRTFIFLLALILVMFIYLIYLNTTNDPRHEFMLFNNVKWWENLIILPGFISIFIVLFASISHAFKYQRYKWVIMLIFIWPLSLLYSILLNTKYVK